jgi:hypothetical protein
VEQAAAKTHGVRRFSGLGGAACSLAGGDDRHCPAIGWAVPSNLGQSLAAHLSLTHINRVHLSFPAPEYRSRGLSGRNTRPEPPFLLASAASYILFHLVTYFTYLPFRSVPFHRAQQEGSRDPYRFPSHSPVCSSHSQVSVLLLPRAAARHEWHRTISHCQRPGSDGRSTRDVHRCGLHRCGRQEEILLAQGPKRTYPAAGMPDAHLQRVLASSMPRKCSPLPGPHFDTDSDKSDPTLLKCHDDIRSLSPSVVSAGERPTIWTNQTTRARYRERFPSTNHSAIGSRRFPLAVPSPLPARRTGQHKPAIPSMRVHLHEGQARPLQPSALVAATTSSSDIACERRGR